MLRRGIFAVLVCLVFAARASAQCEAGWLPGFPTPYLSNGAIINGMMTHDPDGDGPQPEQLIIAGFFSNVEGFSTSNFAVWDGETWSSTPVIAPPSQAMTRYNSEIVVGGNGVSRWNGSSWIQIPSAPTSIRAMCEFGGDLYVGGNFLSGTGPSTIAKWNGSSWSALGTGLGGTSRSVNALLATDAGLIVAGTFTTAGGVASQSAAIWTGSTWIPTTGLSTGLSAPVLTEHQGEVYLCIGGTTAYRLNGTEWVALPIATSGIVGLTSYGGDLYAMTSTLPPLQKWTGTGWESIPDVGGLGLGTSARIAVEFGNDLVVGSKPLVKWNPQESYRTLAIGPNASVVDAEEFNGDVIITGSFTIAGGKRCNGIARFDGTTFHPMGQGVLTDQGGFGADLQVFNGELYVCGDLYTVGRGVAKWDGSAWVRVGSTGFQVFEMCVHENSLHAVGTGISSGVGRLNGGTWSSVGNFVTQTGTFPQAVASHAGALHCAGYLWNGATWQGLQVPSGTWPRNVRGYMLHNAELYLLGEFGNSTGGIGRVEGGFLMPIPGNHNGYSPTGQNVGGSLESYNGDMIAARLFYLVGQSASGVVRHDGIRWSPLAGGVRGGVPPMSSTFWYANFAKNIDGTLWIGGHITHAGGQPSPYLARYRASAGPSITEHPLPIDACIGTDAVLQAAHDQTAGFEVRWRRNREPLEEGIALANGTVPVGVATTTLTLQGVQPGDEGEFDFVVTTLCGSAISDRVQVGVLDAGNDTCRRCPACPADYDQDGGVTGSDIGAFFVDFEQGEACADVDLDGGVTGADIGAFFLAYEAGGC
jgi:hypothetical protein